MRSRQALFTKMWRMDMSSSEALGTEETDRTKVSVRALLHLFEKMLPWNVLLFPSGPQTFQIPPAHTYTGGRFVCELGVCQCDMNVTVVKKSIFGPSERLQAGLFSATAQTSRCTTIEQRSKLAWSGNANSGDTLPPNVSLRGDSTANWHHPLQTQYKHVFVLFRIESQRQLSNVHYDAAM